METECIKLNISNTIIAKNLGVSSQCVSQWLSGKRQPNIEKIPELAKFLDISIEDIVNYLISAKKHYATKNK